MRSCDLGLQLVREPLTKITFARASTIAQISKRFESCSTRARLSSLKVGASEWFDQPRNVLNYKLGVDTAPFGSKTGEITRKCVIAHQNGYLSGVFSKQRPK